MKNLEKMSDKELDAYRARLAAELKRANAADSRRVDALVADLRQKARAVGVDIDAEPWGVVRAKLRVAVRRRKKARVSCPFRPTGRA